MLLAHPLTETGVLPVSPLLAGVLAGCVVAALVRYWPPRVWGRRSSVQAFASWAQTLTRTQIVGRVLGGAVLLLAVAAGRFGSLDELENLAPALLIGAAWPGLLLLSAAGGPVWPWLDPWDGVARVLDRGPDKPSRPDVRPAILVAVAWTWYLGVYPDPLSPRAVGLALAAYSVVTVGGCLLVGRTRWLSRVEMFGILFGSLALLPRGRLPDWTPPRGMDLLLGALAGGLVFGAIRRTDLWGGLNTVPGATIYATGALLASAGLGAVLLRWLASRGAPGGVAVAALPGVAAVAVAVGMARSRLFTSVQLLPSLASDPLGRGWDLFGTAGQRVEPPLQPAEVLVVQLVVLLAGCLAGAVAAAARSEDGAVPGTIASVTLAGVGTMALALAPGL